MSPFFCSEPEILTRISKNSRSAICFAAANFIKLLSFIYAQSLFRAAYAERGMPKNLTFHSDRGGQYISDAFSKLLQQFGVKQSFSATARPHDNAVAEAFFATFKKEEAYRREYTSERHFRQSVDEYICFYNEVRPHATLKYKTPQAFEAAYTNDYIEKTCSNSGGG